jgi:hypothetical protein
MGSAKRLGRYFLIPAALNSWERRCQPGRLVSCGKSPELAESGHTLNWRQLLHSLEVCPDFCGNAEQLGLYWSYSYRAYPSRISFQSRMVSFSRCIPSKSSEDSPAPGLVDLLPEPLAGSLAKSCNSCLWSGNATRCYSGIQGGSMSLVGTHLY